MRGLAPFWITLNDTSYAFPDVSLALAEPDGLLAVGGDLSPGRLVSAYRQGIFPWYNHDQPILWWSPDPRAVLFLNNLKISRSLKKSLRRRRFTVTFDQDFSAVIKACSKTRADGAGTWITNEMYTAYNHMHTLGLAHSVECWQDHHLVGGLYGIALGKVFFGESMFSQQTDASKVALVHLCQYLDRHGFQFIDCQVSSDHLMSLGAEAISRNTFIDYLERYCAGETDTASWHNEIRI
jgi:leucyl/phenylalanyl-tRNA--protein transferase